MPCAEDAGLVFLQGGELVRVDLRGSEPVTTKRRIDGVPRELGEWHTSGGLACGWHGRHLVFDMGTSLVAIDAEARMVWRTELPKYSTVLTLRGRLQSYVAVVDDASQRLFGIDLENRTVAWERAVDGLGGLPRVISLADGFLVLTHDTTVVIDAATGKPTARLPGSQHRAYLGAFADGRLWIHDYDEAPLDDPSWVLLDGQNLDVIDHGSIDMYHFRLE